MYRTLPLVAPPVADLDDAGLWTASAELPGVARVAYGSHIGRRRQVQADHAAVHVAPGALAVVVADGAGDFWPAAEVAQIAADVAAPVAAHLQDAGTAVEAARAAVVRRNETADREAVSTIAALIVSRWMVDVAWCGDSPVWALDSAGQVAMLTDPLGHPMHGHRVHFGGDSYGYDLERCNVADGGIHQVVRRVEPDPGGVRLRRLLVASDGLTHRLDGEEIAELLAQPWDVFACRDALIRAAVDAGGLDNVTVAVVELVE